MHDDDDPCGSSEQTAWIELAAAVRAQLLKAAELLPAMKPEEQKQFIDACREAIWLHHNALCFDKEAELQQARLPYSS